MFIIGFVVCMPNCACFSVVQDKQEGGQSDSREFPDFASSLPRMCIVIMRILSVLCVPYTIGSRLAKYGALHLCIRQARVGNRQKTRSGRRGWLMKSTSIPVEFGDFRGFPIVPGIPKTSILSIHYSRRPDLAFLASNHSSLPSTRV
jgi:hypothetical protein